MEAGPPELKPAHTEVGTPSIPRRDDLRVVRAESRFNPQHNGFFQLFPDA